ncbi:unnamed protein product, partial [Notodromas monacha]
MVLLAVFPEMCSGGIRQHRDTKAKFNKEADLERPDINFKADDGRELEPSEAFNEESYNALTQEYDALYDFIGGLVLVAGSDELEGFILACHKNNSSDCGFIMDNNEDWVSKAGDGI